MSLLLFLALHSISVASPGVSSAAQEDDGLLVQTAIVPLSLDGRIDHLAIDRKRERLYIAAVGNGSVEVIDLKQTRVQRSIRDLKGPQGILYLDDADRMVVACAGGTVEVFDGESLERVASVEVGHDADNLQYDPRAQRAYVGIGDNAIALVDARTWKLEEKYIVLQAKPEGFQLDADGKRAFVNTPGSHQFAVLDLEAQKVATTWAVGEAGHNFPLAIVPASMGSASEPLLLIGCRAPAKLVMRWALSGKSAGELKLSDDVDDLYVDEKRRRVYASCGGGSVDIFGIDDKLAVRRLERVITAPGARTCLFVPERDQLFVAVPIRPPQRAELRIYSVRD
jgi:hypothetical protein